jgi:hypothetical protein
MSNEKSLIEKLKIVLGMVENHTLAQAKLEDGTVVEFDGEELVVGSIVYIVPAEGEKTFAPAGEHVLENGSKIVISEEEGKEGVVTEILEKEEEVGAADEPGENPEEEEEEEVKAAITPEEQTAIVSELMQILEPRIAALEEAVLMMGANYKEENEELKSQIQKLSAEPGGAPVKTPLQLPDASENALTRIAKNKRK